MYSPKIPLHKLLHVGEMRCACCFTYINAHHHAEILQVHRSKARITLQGSVTRFIKSLICNVRIIICFLIRYSLNNIQ